MQKIWTSFCHVEYTALTNLLNNNKLNWHLKKILLISFIILFIYLYYLPWGEIVAISYAK